MYWGHLRQQRQHGRAGVLGFEHASRGGHGRGGRRRRRVPLPQCRLEVVDARCQLSFCCAQENCRLVRRWSVRDAEALQLHPARMQS